MSKFYKVLFFDKRNREYNEHYVFTVDMSLAKAEIELEEPYVQIISWLQVEEKDLPDLVVVIQK